MNSLKALFVDDETEFIETLLKRIKRRGIAADGVNSGKAAIQYLETSPVDVVVLDVKMPGMDGIETLREIKRKHPLIEVIMLTAHANVEVAIEGMELGAFDYLMKPMDIDELIYKLQDAYKKRQVQEEKIYKIRHSDM